ncbi:MAG: hypothetical protein ACLR8Y_11695 [Alistipes indistinctus]
MHIIPPGIGGGSFLTNTTGELLANTLPNSLLIHGELPMWWFYFHFARCLFSSRCRSRVTCTSLPKFR